MKKITSLIAPTLIAFTIASTTQAAELVKPTSTCLTKIRSTVRLIDLYVEADQVDSFIMDQVDITTRLCADATDPAFKNCHDSFQKMAGLAHAGQGIDAHQTMAKTAAPECAAYMALKQQDFE